MKQILAKRRKELFTPSLPLCLVFLLCIACQASNGLTFVFLPSFSGQTVVYILDPSDKYMVERKEECGCMCPLNHSRVQEGETTIH